MQDLYMYSKAKISGKYDSMTMMQESFLARQRSLELLFSLLCFVLIEEEQVCFG